MADDFKYVKELLTTGAGTQGTLLIPRKIYDTIIEEVKKVLIPRTESAIYFGPGDIPGASIDLNLVSPNTMKARLVAEGAEIPIDSVTYTNLNVKPLKYGVTVKITRELLEDAQWNLLEHNVMYAGRRLAENENTLVIAALDAAANTVTGGAATTIANITRAMQYLNDNDFMPTTYLTGFEVLNDLRNIDTFVEYQKLGTTEMLNTGYVGTLYGMNVIQTSTNAGMTATSSYVFDNRWAYVLAEKRPVTVENFELPTHDMSAAVVTQRVATAALRTSAIAKITTT